MKLLDNDLILFAKEFSFSYGFVTGSFEGKFAFGESEESEITDQHITLKNEVNNSKLF